MKRVHVLGGLLAALLVAAGVLYSKGYWDTWEDKRSEVVEALKADVAKALKEQNPEVDPKIGEEYAECVGNGVIDAVIQAGCPLDGLKEAIPQIEQCTSEDPGAGLFVMLTLMQCSMEAQAKLGAAAAEPAN